MRSFFFCLAVGLLLSNVTTASAQSGSSRSSSDPPDQIAGKSLEQWIVQIKSRDPSTRQTAIRTVVLFGKDSRKAAPYLIEALDDRDASCRVYASLSMISLVGLLEGDEATVAKAVRALGNRLNDSQAIVRFHAAIALGMFGPSAQAAIPNLISRLADPYSWEIRRAVVVSLGNIARDDKAGPDPRTVVALSNIFLATSNAEPSAQVRLEVAIALGLLGRPNDTQELQRAIAALRRGVRDSDVAVSIWAQAALMALDRVSEEGLDVIAKHLKGKDTNAKVHAARALAAMREQAKSKVPELIALLGDSDPVAALAGVTALGEMDGYAFSAVEPLKKLADDPNQNEYLRRVAKSTAEKLSAKPGG